MTDMDWNFDFGPVSLPLVEWYRKSARDLPWRHTARPYPVWVSEIMLQQTRVEAVKPYFNRFLERFPDVSALAACGEDELNKLWEGLGYYSRARNLHRAAVLAAESGFPKNFEGWLNLPGVGPYTAAAVSSICFGEPVAAVDGNVLRVVSRLSRLEEDVGDPRTRRAVFTALNRDMPRGKRVLQTASVTPFGVERNDTGDFNQAMMELGALICLPNGTPLCLACPLSGLCEGFRTGTAPGFPLRAPKRERRVEERTVLLLESGGRFVLRKRPADGLLGGLWEFPSLPGRLSAGAVRERLEEFCRVAEICPAGEAMHVFTHLEWHMTGFRVRVEDAPKDWFFVTREELIRDYAMPSALAYFREKIAD